MQGVLPMKKGGILRALELFVCVRERESEASIKVALMMSALSFLHSMLCSYYECVCVCVRSIYMCVY
jgi:hypothetical protein